MWEGALSEVGEPESWPAAKPPGFDPEAAPSLRRFWAIQGSTECIFAETSVMWGCPDWEVGLDLELNLTAWLPVIVRFVQECEGRKLDGLVLEMPGPGYGDSVEALGRTAARVLRFLGSADAAGHNRMNEVIEDLPGGSPSAVRSSSCLHSGRVTPVTARAMASSLRRPIWSSSRSIASRAGFPMGPRRGHSECAVRSGAGTRRRDDPTTLRSPSRPSRRTAT